MIKRWAPLLIFVFATYAFFLGDRVLPPGDPKVYLNQVAEMIENNTYFQQWLMGEPNYFKGPLHYLFVRLGYFIFGESLWSALYMNLLLLMAGTLAVAVAVYRELIRFEPEKRAYYWALLAGVIFSTAAGVYGQFYASQMEIELLGLSSIAAFLILRGKNEFKDDLWIWLMIGVVGWVKSPLHSFLLGWSAILFWAMRRELIPRLKDYQRWLAVGAGVVTSIAGYLPAILTDFDSIYRTYWLTQSVGTQGTLGRDWWQPIVAIFFYLQWPWVFCFLVSYADIVYRKFKIPEQSQRLVSFGFAMLLPTVLFFLYYTYRNEYYHLFANAGAVFILVGLWSSASPKWKIAYRVGVALGGITILCLSLGLVYVFGHFREAPAWLPPHKFYLTALCILIAAGALFVAAARKREAIPWPVGLIYVGLSGFFVMLSGRELIDLKEVLKESPSRGVSYYNLHRNVWNECTHIRWEVGRKIQCLYEKSQLTQALERKDFILVRKKAHLDSFRAETERLKPDVKYELELWTRWGTQAHLGRGQDLSFLERVSRYGSRAFESESYIVKVK